MFTYCTFGGLNCFFILLFSFHGGSIRSTERNDVIYFSSAHRDFLLDPALTKYFENTYNNIETCWSLFTVNKEETPKLQLQVSFSMTPPPFPLMMTVYRGRDPSGLIGLRLLFVSKAMRTLSLILFTQLFRGRQSALLGLLRPHRMNPGGY